jgi:tetratricopeptide (TPR) repeat protein
MLALPLALTGLIGFFALISRFASAGEDAPEVPARDDVVIEHLPSGKGDPETRADDDRRKKLAANPTDLRLAVRVARRDIELSRTRSDPRYLGHAEAALGPWYKLSAPPYDVLLLRATIRQSNHDFDGALSDLASARALRADDPQLFLTLAVILTVRAEYPAARDACARVRTLMQTFAADVCDAAIFSVTGRAGPAYESLSNATAALPPSQAALHGWGVSTLGEIAERKGDLAAAEARFKEALAEDPNDAYVLGAYADLLLDLGRPAEVIPLLARRTENDGLLLRLVLAEKALPSAKVDFLRDKELLRARYDASQARGDVVHRREQARFALQVDDDAERALRLARDNYAVQREVADARIFMEAARAAGDPGAAAAARAWVAENRVEDPRLRALAGAP